MVCFARSYSTAHLAQHPRQNVRSMTLLVYKPDPAPANRPYAIRAGVNFKNAKERFDSYGECSGSGGPGGKFDCGLECDAGHVSIRKNGGSSIYVDVPAGSHLSECGEDTELLGEDDRLFKLEQVKLGECLPLVENSQELKAKLLKKN